MEFFNNSQVVKIRSHLDKYIVADDDQQTVRQSRNSTSRKTRWSVEFVEGKSHVIRLKSCHGRYLTASDTPFLLGMTGKRVIQTLPYTKSSDSSIEWEPIRDGFQVKIRSCHGGKFLRGNGGTPPWRNSITHDKPQSGGTKNWVLWEVEAVDDSEEFESGADCLSSMSSFSSVFSDDEPGSPMSVATPTKSARLRFSPSPMSAVASTKSPRFSLRPTGMDLFKNAKAVRLRSHHDKYLLADDDEESVTQDRNGSSKNAKWTIEFVENSPTDVVRLKSCYNKYLTASNQPFLLGMTGRKALQTRPKRLDSSVEWEPVREGMKVKLKTRYGHFLRANGGLPPWRNSITHDIPHRTATQEWILWDVDIVEIQVRSPAQTPTGAQPDLKSDSFASDSSSPSSVSVKSSTFSRQESNDSIVSSPPKVGGRAVYYYIADEAGDVDESLEEYSLTITGNGVEELRHRLEEETGLDNIIVCSRSPLNGNLYPLRLQLPPNNTTMHVVVVQSSSNLARGFAKSGIPL